MPDNTPNSPTIPPSADRRGWLAALLLRQPDRFLPRLAAAVRQWCDLPRRLRRRVQRKAAAATLGAALVFGLAGGAFHAQPVHAANINVDDGYVIAADDGFCSLIEAIRNANSNSQLFASPGECAAGSGDDVINLPVDGYFPLLGDDAPPTTTMAPARPACRASPARSPSKATARPSTAPSTTPAGTSASWPSSAAAT